MFVIYLHYMVPSSTVDAVRPAHIEFLEKFYQLKKILVSGKI